MVLKSLIENLQIFSLQNLGVKRFHFDFEDNLDDFGLKDSEFPIVFVVPSFTENISNTSGYYGQSITLDIYVLDRLKEDRTNVLTVMNETNNIINDIIIFFKNNKQLSLDEDAFLTEPINNMFINYTAGYRASVSFIVDSQSDCFTSSSGGGRYRVSLFNSLEELVDQFQVISDTDYTIEDIQIEIYIEEDYKDSINIIYPKK